MIIPILSVLFGWWFLKEKILLINLLGISLAFGGTIIILGLPQLIMGNLTPQMLTGNFLIILASISWVGGAIISKQLLIKYSSLVITAVSFMVGTVTMVIPASYEYIQNPGWPSSITMLGILGLTYMTLLSSISAYFLFEWGLSKTSVVIADLFYYIEPFIATILAVAILGEKISKSFLFGAVLMAVGVYLGTLAKERYHRHKQHRI